MVLLTISPMLAVKNSIILCYDSKICSCIKSWAHIEGQNQYIYMYTF